ncbi:putative aldouronate transport system substrate-binding protein [Paenibacillus favisporus]|uniref:Aldouronate transport system substrate-binding protein n=1 Tax=Paenibacillus favisporus TaxID=221028 RepID=A0ABV2F4Z5_9BACL|nr:extracellular solute-binding protein [Paenibacillus cellulositrophicus]MCM2998116.1 extracellular solute-binding protein [Paenibacillus cellulositrophicus]
MKKWVSLILAAALVTGLTAGCGNKSASSGSDDAADASKPVKFSISLTTSGNAYAEGSKDINNEKWVKEVEKRANVDLDIRLIPLKDFDAKMAVMFAGGDIPDVVQNVGGATDKSMAGSVQAGVFMPLDDLLKEYAPNLMKAVPKEAWDEVSYKGKIYGVPTWLSNPSRRATYIRTDLLEKTGLPAPQTMDDFLNVLRAFKKLGVSAPYQMRENFKYADIVFGAYDALGYQFTEMNGQVVPKFFNAENMEKALTVYKTMYDEGLIQKDFATIQAPQYSENIEAGNAGMWTANAASLLDFRTKIGAAVPGAKVDIIPSPIGDNGQKGYGLYSSVNTSLYINSKVSKEKAARIIQMFEWMQTPEAKNFYSFGIEGEDYTVKDGKIDYKLPEGKAAQDEAGFRSLLRWVGDGTINRERTELLPGGQDVLKALDDTLAKEGVGGIGFVPDLESFSQFPDLASKRPDQAPKLIIDHMVKMIYGKEPISDFPKVIEEYKQKGGDEIVKEATERYNNKDGIIDQQSRK